jgi:hypothetical protein
MNVPTPVASAATASALRMHRVRAQFDRETAENAYRATRAETTSVCALSRAWTRLSVFLFPRLPPLQRDRLRALCRQRPEPPLSSRVISRDNGDAPEHWTYEPTASILAISTGQVVWYGPRDEVAGSAVCLVRRPRGIPHASACLL